MAVLLQILIESIILVAFLWIGASIMKAQLRFKVLLVTALAGSLASQVPFIGTYISFAVVLFFLWKMARVDMVPDGVLILVIGKGAGLILTIYAVALLMDHVETDTIASRSHIPIYTDDDGKRYYADGDLMYYLNDEDEKVYVDAEEVLGFSDILKVAAKEPPEETQAPNEDGEQTSAEDSSAIAVASYNLHNSSAGFSEPLLSDSVIRGQLIPYEVFVPQNWRIKNEPGLLSMRLNDHTFLRCHSDQQGSTNNPHVREEVERVLATYPGYEIADQEVVTLDGKKWGLIHFANPTGDQVLLLSHADLQGSYSIELQGSYEQLAKNKAILHRMMFSFNFPPSTYFLAQLEAEE